jgi:L-ascorbate metabolism protein UlaG (beta-lactamase superfamily)
VPLGIGAHLERWGVSPGGIVEINWNENAQVNGLTLTAAIVVPRPGQLVEPGHPPALEQWWR